MKIEILTLKNAILSSDWSKLIKNHSLPVNYFKPSVFFEFPPTEITESPKPTVISSDDELSYSPQLNTRRLSCINDTIRHNSSNRPSHSSSFRKKDLKKFKLISSDEDEDSEDVLFQNEILARPFENKNKISDDFNLSITEEEDIHIPSSPETTSAPTTPIKPKKKTLPIVNTQISTGKSTLKRKSLSLNPTSLNKAREKLVQKELDPNFLEKNNILPDPTLKTLTKEELTFRCSKFGIGKNLGKREMITKLNEINGNTLFTCSVLSFFQHFKSCTRQVDNKAKDIF